MYNPFAREKTFVYMVESIIKIRIKRNFKKLRSIRITKIIFKRYFVLLDSIKSYSRYSISVPQPNWSNAPLFVP